jgi:hypothetical protein
MTYGEGQEDRGDIAFALGDIAFGDASARSDSPDNLGGEAVVALAGEFVAHYADGKMIGTDVHWRREWMVSRFPDGGRDGTERVNLYEGRTTAAPAGPPASRSASTDEQTTGDRSHFALTAALAENERLREALTAISNAATNLDVGRHTISKFAADALSHKEQQ